MESCPVTVIIPTYNRENYLPQALTSVLRQSLPCREVIVVDDGSTDNTSIIVETIANRSPVTVRYLSQENRGVASARNVGISASCSEYLAFLDSDDYWQRDKLKIQFTMMKEHPEYLISHTREKWLRRGVHLNQKKRHQPCHGDIFNQCLQLCCVGMSTVMARKKLFREVGCFDENYPCCEDYELWLRVGVDHHFLLVPEPLTVKQGGREDQLSQRYRIGMDRFRIKAMEQILASDQVAGEREWAVKNELVKKLTIYGNGCIRHGRKEEGERCLERAGQIL